MAAPLMVPKIVFRWTTTTVPLRRVFSCCSRRYRLAGTIKQQGRTITTLILKMRRLCRPDGSSLNGRAARRKRREDNKPKEVQASCLLRQEINGTARRPYYGEELN